MIDRSSRLSKKPSGVHASAAATVHCHGNCHDVTSSPRFARDGGDAVGDAPEHLQLSDVNIDRMTAVPPHHGTPMRSPGVRFVDDCELAADAEVCWLLRHGAAVTPRTPEIEPAIGGLSIGSTEAPLVASVAPDFDCVPPSGVFRGGDTGLCPPPRDVGKKCALPVIKCLMDYSTVSSIKLLVKLCNI